MHPSSQDTSGTLTEEVWTASFVTVEVFFNVGIVETLLFSFGRIDWLKDIGKDILGQVEAIQGLDNHLSLGQEVLLFNKLVDKGNSPRLGRSRA